MLSFKLFISVILIAIITATSPVSFAAKKTVGPEEVELYLLWSGTHFDYNYLEKYEEALIRKISELIYVPHKDFIAAKLRVQNS